MQETTTAVNQRIADIKEKHANNAFLPSLVPQPPVRISTNEINRINMAAMILASLGERREGPFGKNGGHRSGYLQTPTDIVSRMNLIPRNQSGVIKKKKRKSITSTTATTARALIKRRFKEGKISPGDTLIYREHQFTINEDGDIVWYGETYSTFASALRGNKMADGRSKNVYHEETGKYLGNM